jgi:hypothetical protein
MLRSISIPAHLYESVKITAGPPESQMKPSGKCLVLRARAQQTVPSDLEGGLVLTFIYGL